MANHDKTGTRQHNLGGSVAASSGGFGEVSAPAAPSSAFTPEQMAQIKEMMQQAFTAGAASVPRLPDDEFKAQQRLAQQAEAAKREHPLQRGNLRHGQTLADGTKIEGETYWKDGEELRRETPVRYRKTPQGSIIVEPRELEGKYL